ncbi:tumor necrosis factor receptor superfamily member 11B-like [Clupea harengus]|uniref:Tumor necrosis factor receptor superfamily member 11B-like n=1 Tax=Clupea harengus TaxID=7950 RepID=A0A8M1KGQ9_CLUHA|nr:tumor necrosis factor receptor superfamily member 11B-like [Clupea harengus]
MCEQGYHLVQHCSATHPTKCALCNHGLYTEFWNFVANCLICDTCADNQVISHQCSPSQNTKCVCKEGYFWNRYFCQRHKMCGSGYGVKTKGTPYEDTECELCQRGFYAAGKPGHATLQQYTDCKTNGLITVLKGKTWHDAICASCDNVHKGDPKKSYILNRLHYILPKYVYVCLCVSS